MKKYMLLTIFGLLILTGCGYLNQMLGIPDDNIGEEIVEEVIEIKTGIDVDLTPSSPE